MKKLIISAVVLLAILVLAAAGALKWCWNNRDTTESRREARKAASKELRETPRAEGCPRVWIHGEKELESEVRLRREGIPMNEKTIAELRRIAADLNLPEPPFGPA